MGIQIVQKSDLKRPRQKKPVIALVLAGGAISGGAFKLGGLIALNTYLEGTKITDFDIYVGVSAGAIVAAPLAAGVPRRTLPRRSLRRWASGAHRRSTTARRAAGY